MTDLTLPFPPWPTPDGDPTPDRDVGRLAAGRRIAGDRTRDGGDPDHVAHPPDALARFVGAGVLAAADVHVATALARLVGDHDDEVLLAAALAVRAPRRAHVCVDLRNVRSTVVGEQAEDPHAVGAGGGVDPIEALRWPDPSAWLTVLAGSPLVAVRDPEDLHEPDDRFGDVRPLTLAGDRLYLDRYWRYERRTARILTDRAARQVEDVDVDRLHADLDATFDGPAPDRQRVAAALAVTRHLTVIAGGPGTGKTTTVARILRLLDAQAEAAGARPPAIALAAPTGKAAARLTESLREAAGDDAAGSRLRDATATTLHRLLGATGTGRRFRRDRHDPLPHDVVVVDETSMVDLPMLARLLDAVRDDARVILLGDPHQLASVEAGSVLADVVGDPEATPVRSGGTRATLGATAGPAHVEGVEAASAGLADGLVVLDRVHRFRPGSGLDRFAAAVRAGDADAAIDQLRGKDDLSWVAPSGDALDAWRRRGPSDAQLEAVRDRVVGVGQRLRDAARAGDGATALAALDDLRLLCAHRRGEAGVAGWTARVEAWLEDALDVDVRDRWYPGRPVLITANDPRLQVWNGDLGVVVLGDGGVPAVALPALDGAGVRHLAPARLGEVQTVHAMTVHKAQGSQVEHAVVVLPEPASRICTRELLYTAVTRARLGATVVASEATLRATIAASTQRASGLGDALRR